jgi:hypothetical protein
MMALVHGGETILPTHKTDSSQQAMSVTVPVYLDGKMIANVVTPYLLGDKRARTGRQGAGS